MLPTLFILFSIFSSSLVFAWQYSNGSFFTPCSGTLSDNPTATVSDEMYQRLSINRGYLDQLDYLASLNDTNLWKFNFNPKLRGNNHASYGAGGLAILANRANAPSLIATGVAMAMGFLEPCGINTYHYHPFATQLVTVISGGPLEVGAIWSNAAGGEQFHTTVSTWEMVTLPQGSIHYAFNNNCEPLVTANAFSSDDPGILNVANTLFKFDPNVVKSILGYPEQLNGQSIGDFGKGIPPSYAFGAQSCLTRCGISKTSQGGSDS